MDKSGASQITVQLEADLKQKRDKLAEAALESWEHYKATGLHLTMAEADAWLAELEKGHDVEPPPCHR